LKIEQRVKKTVMVKEDEPVAEAKEGAQEQEVAAQEEEVKEEEKPAPVAEKKTTPVKYKYHTIQPGDTLYKIASKYDGVTVTSIKSLNGGLRENKLVVGQKIKIKKIG
jgi:membrane-bound lytic murein transglycosylase D